MSLLWNRIKVELDKVKPKELSSSAFEKEYYASQVTTIAQIFENNEKESDQHAALADLLFKYFDQKPNPTSTYLVDQDIRKIVLQELATFIRNRNDAVEIKWFNEKRKEFKKAEDQYNFTMKRVYFD